ncbi:MAG: TRAP transporter substrate-binding protein DctP [Deltaproteobacteria bacterium]|nr:TRAP transporter substrate-binding protein DctP [Deltaproteobacteria bacterium]
MRARSSAVAALLVLVLGAQAEAAEYEIKMATLAPEGSLWMKELQKFDSRVQQATNGEVRFKFYFGGIAGDDKQVVEKLKSGQLHAAGLTGVGLGDIVPAFRVMEIPFTYRTYQEFDLVLSKLSTWFKNQFEEKGFVVMGWADTGFVYLMSKKKLATVDDVRKAKPWAWDVDQVAVVAFKAFGINPTLLSLESVTTNLDAGAIDTVYMAPAAAIAFSWHKQVSYLVDFPLTNGAGAVVVTKSYWNSLPENHRQTILLAAKETMKTFRAKTRKENDAALATMKSKGITFLKPSDKDIQEFGSVGAKAADQLAGKLYSKKLLEKVRSILAKHRGK